MKRSQLLPLLLLPLLLLMGSPACVGSGSDSESGDEAPTEILEPPEVVSGVDAHGFVVVVAGTLQASIFDHLSFGLVDPRTGATSDVVGHLFGTIEPWARPFGIDPAGERLAWWDKGGGQAILRIGRVVVQDGAPGLALEHSFPMPLDAMAIPEGPRFNSLGDRVYAARTSEVVWADLDAGEVRTMAPTAHANPNRAHFAVSPDGRRAVVCNAIGEHCAIFADGRWEAPLDGVRFVEWPGGELMSPDGQWMLHAAPGSVGLPTKVIDAVHLPSRASRILDVANLELATGEVVNANLAGQTMLFDGVPRFHPRGGLVARAEGVHGWGESSSLTLGGVKSGLVYRPMRPEPRLLMDAGATWEKGVFVAGEELPLGPRPRYLLWDSSSWRTIGFSPDGETEVLALEHSMADAPVGSDVTALVDRSTGEWTELWGGMGCASVGHVEQFWRLDGLEPGGFQCGSVDAAAMAPVAGLSPGGTWFQRADFSFLVSEDGRWSAGAAAPVQDGSGHLCLHPSEAPWQTHCVPLSGPLAASSGSSSTLAVYSVGDLAMAWVGHAVGPAPASPVLTGLSRRAAVPGTEVYVYGLGFGDSKGGLRIGGVEVASSAISKWSDTRIAFTTSSALPEMGEVQVTAGGISSTTGRVFLARTEAWSPSTPLPDLAGGASLAQGDNVLSAPQGVDAGYFYELVDRAGTASVIALSATFDEAASEVTLVVPVGTSAGSYWLRIQTGEGVTHLLAVEVGS